MPGGPPPDHRVGRQARLLVFLRGATLITVLASIIAVLVPGRVGRAGGAAVFAALVAVPLLRVVWLGLRWVRRRDWLFAGVAGLLLVIIGTATVVA